MSAPRHLWSGDWQSESSSHAEDVAARRGRREEPAEIEPAVPPPRRSRIGPAIRMVRERLRRLRARRRGRHRVAWLAALLTLLVAGAAYALASDLIKSPQRAAVSGSGPWLGVDLTNAPMP